MQTPEQVIANAYSLQHNLLARWDRANHERCIPDETVAEMHEAGLFKVLQPKRYGGYEMHPNVFYKVQMALAEACMSTAWIYGVIGVHQWQLALYDDQAQQDVWGQDNTTLISSSYMPKAAVQRVTDGYIVSGEWGFSSGVDHCDWAFLGGITPEDKEFRTFLIPKSDFTIIDNWDTFGIRGSGSKTVSVVNAFVPSYRTHKSSDGAKQTSPGLAVNHAPLYKLPFGQIFVRAVSTAHVGALQGALNCFVDWNKHRIGSNDGSKSSEDPIVRQLVAKTALDIKEMKSTLFQTFDTMMDKVSNNTELELLDRLHWRTQSAGVPDKCAELVTKLFHNGGAHGLYKTSPLGRYFIDINCGRTHVANNIDKISRNYGAVLLGAENTDTFI